MSLVPNILDLIGGALVSEGVDATSSSLTGIALTATELAPSVAFVGWTCIRAPGAGDVNYPTGTTTGAVNAGIADAGSRSTTVDVPGPGSYTFEASWFNGTTETYTVFVTRPRPSISEATYSNGSTGTVAAGATALALSDAGGSDSPTWATSVERADTGASVSVTGSTTATPSATLGDAADNSGNAYAWDVVLTDAYGRTDRLGFTLRVSGYARLDPPTPPAAQQLAATTSTHTMTFTGTGNLGGEGSISYGASLTEAGGSGATIDSVTDNGATVDVALSGLSDDTVVNVKLTATDSATPAQEASGWGAIMVLNEDPVSATVSPAGATRTTSGNQSFTITPAGGSGSYTYALQGSFSKPGGSSATLDDPTTTTPDFTGMDVDGEYSAVIRVADSADATDYFDVTLYAVLRTPATDPPVLAPPADPNIDANDPAPTVNFGNTGGAVVSTAASITYKPDGSTATLTFASPSLAPVLNYDLPGKYGVQLSGTNVDGTDIRTAPVTVNSIAPTANAGPDQLLVTAASTVNLDGSASALHASSVGPLAYSWGWSADSPATATLTGATTATPSFTAGAKGLTYIAELTVTDQSTGETAANTVRITTEAENRYPTLVQYIDFTAADATSWANGTTTGTITDDSGGTTLATWTRIAASGNSTGYNFHVSSEGFGFDTGLETSATGVSVTIQLDINWSALPDDLDGMIIGVVFTAELNSGTPGSGRDENVSMAVAVNGASANAAHTNGVRILNDPSGKFYYRRVAGALSQPQAMTYSSNNRYVMYFRADRYDGRVDVAKDVSGLLSVAEIDSYAYDYSRIGTSAISGGPVSDSPYDQGVNGPAIQFLVRNDYPAGDGGGPTQAHVEGIAIYTAGVAQ